MKTVVNLIDDTNPGGIRSLLNDMADTGLWPGDAWRIRAVNSCAPVRLDCKPEYIVVHYSMAWRKVPALMLLRRANPQARLIIVEHHYSERFEEQHVTNTGRFRALLRLCYSMADQVIAVSTAQAGWLSAARIVDAAKLRTIPACRDYSNFLAIPRIEKRTGPLLVGALGRVEHVKGFDLLIDAFAKLPKDQFRLRIAGDGSQLAALQQRAAGLDHVEFIGHIDDPVPFLASCDVLAMPSRHETFGLSCAEAKAAGLPVIVSDVDALPEQALGCGIVVEPDNANALCEAMMAMKPLARRLTYGRNARKRVVNAWSEFLSSWTQVLA